MSFNCRKLYVAALTLQVALAVYFLYVFFSGTPRIKISDVTTPVQTDDEFKKEVGMVGNIGVGTVETAKFINYNEDKTISREFGFEKLLHKIGDQWQIENPFMNIYQPAFECRITADSGLILAQETVSTPNLKDATLTGNVIIEILPKEQSNTGPIYIFLDDIVFISERSLFLTAGPVKIISQNTELLGIGLELVYNYEVDRIELFRIIHLKSLNLKNVSKESLLAKNDETTDKPTLEKAQISQGPSQTKPEGETYQCLFKKNVLIKTPQRLVFAYDTLLIDKIYRSRGFVEDVEKIETVLKTKVSKSSETTDDFIDVEVTCDSGLVMTPLDNPAEQISTIPFASKEQSALQNAEKLKESAQYETVFFSEQINYNAKSDEIIATGYSELTFYSDETTGSNITKTKTPIQITAQKQVRFTPKTNELIFEGNCKSTMTKIDSGTEQQYSFSAQKITAELSRDIDSLSYASSIKHLSAEDEALLSVTTAGDFEKQTTFTAQRIDYDTSSENIFAVGPTELTFYTKDLSQTSTGNKPMPVKISAQKSTQFFLASNKVIFEGNCTCTFLNNDFQNSRKYTLSAPKLTVELISDKQNRSALSGASIKHITAGREAIVTITEPTDNKELARFTALQIEYDSSANEIFADGLSQFAFQTRDVIAERQETLLPIRITAHEKTKFLTKTNQVLFQGNCICTMIRSDSNIHRKFTLTAPQITASLAGNKSASFSSSGIEHLTAGEDVTIVVTPLDSVAELATFKSPKINYSALAEEIVADGPVDFTFYVNDFISQQELGGAVPVKIMAQNKAKFWPETNQIFFEGDCLCTMVRTELNSQNKYTLSAPKLTIDLSKDTDKGPSSSAVTIDHFAADGGVVQISNVKTSDKKLLGLHKIKCLKFQFDAGEKIFSATGPGLISVDNSKITESRVSLNKFSLQKRCYAFLRDFKNLNYYSQTNKITARNNTQKILIDYLPIAKGKNEEQVKASASSIEVNLADTKNQTEIEYLNAAGGITYEDNENQFIGSTFSYNAEKAIITADGGETQRCFLNGTMVNNIVYDLRTSKVLNIDITDTSVVQLKK